MFYVCENRFVHVFFLFYEIIQFYINVLLLSKSLLFLCVSMGLSTHCHTQTFHGKIFTVPPQTDIVSFW